MCVRVGVYAVCVCVRRCVCTCVCMCASRERTVLGVIPSPFILAGRTDPW